MLTAISLLSLLSSTVAAFYVPEQAQHSLSLEDVKVPVTLGVMSACPDALKCEAVFNRVLQRVGDKIDLTLTYVAAYASRHAYYYFISNQACVCASKQGERIRA